MLVLKDLVCLLLIAVGLGLVEWSSGNDVTRLRGDLSVNLVLLLLCSRGLESAPLGLRNAVTSSALD